MAWCDPEAVLLLIPVVDWATDVLVVISTVLDGRVDDDRLYFAGFILFCISQALRFLNESNAQHELGCYLDKKFGRGDPNEANRTSEIIIATVAQLSCFHVPLGVIRHLFLGLISFLGRVAAVALAPLDLACGFGMYSASGEFSLPLFEFVVELNSVSDFYKEQGLIGKYYHLVSSIAAGGRWKAIVYCKWKAKHLADQEQTEITDSFDEGFPSLLLTLLVAVYEEVLENVGGLCMSISVLIGDSKADGGFGRSSMIASASIAFSVLSAAYETGYLWGKLGTYDEDQQSTGSTNDA